eukprot:CAMPEP_0170475624 /NCGR_PEP_ID=MMETSP0123-20130129/17236_1 /TAXON_ID=182087 /ORGANISM="Favella ehrenbergii, Strain Fehren 1" /LENGTH=67 /DNA_ID=CAMNT_0010746243 /DNA_START=64 /DNA_END=268 /DNA_ORIENTATION=-
MRSVDLHLLPIIAPAEDTLPSERRVLDPESLSPYSTASTCTFPFDGASQGKLSPRKAATGGWPSKRW